MRCASAARPSELNSKHVSLSILLLLLHGSLRTLSLSLNAESLYIFKCVDFINQSQSFLLVSVAALMLLHQRDMVGLSMTQSVKEKQTV